MYVASISLFAAATTAMTTTLLFCSETALATFGGAGSGLTQYEFALYRDCCRRSAPATATTAPTAATATAAPTAVFVIIVVRGRVVVGGCRFFRDETGSSVPLIRDAPIQHIQ